MGHLRTDPLTGEPWTLCADTVTTTCYPVPTPLGDVTYAVCGGCGAPAYTNERGVWVYVDPPTCPDCGGEVYRCLAETFGATGSMRSHVQYRHTTTQRIACEGGDPR